MSAQATSTGSLRAPLWGELRDSAELARLLKDRSLHASRRRPDAQPVLLVPGFMAGDGSLTMLRHWLRRRGHPVAMSGMRANGDCAEGGVTRPPPATAAAGFRRRMRTPRRAHRTEPGWRSRPRARGARARARLGPRD